MYDNSIKKNDYLIRISPMEYSDGGWSGEIDVSIITGEDNNLSDDDYSQLLHLTKMVASTIPIMEYNEELRSEVHNFVQKYVDEVDIEFEPEPGLADKVVDREENIIKIDFSTKTRGSA